jgi:hypothetical protein
MRSRLPTRLPRLERPDRLRPAQFHLPQPGAVDGGVERAEALREGGGIERRAQEGADELLFCGSTCRVRRCSRKRSRSTVAVSRAWLSHSTLSWWLVATAAWVMRAGRSGAIITVQEMAVPVDHGDVVAHVRGDARQRRAGLGRGFAGLQHVAQDQRHAEAVADHPPPAEGQRDRKARVVHPVDQPPEPVGGAQHPAALPAGAQHQPRRRRAGCSRSCAPAPAPCPARSPGCSPKDRAAGGRS